MYRLLLFYPGDDSPAKTLHMELAPDILERIPTLLKNHPGCERIEVFLGISRLFTVDCAGNSTAG
jgi:hypothetical protein